MQLSTKDLFGIVAFCAVVAWTASLAGIDSPAFVVGAGATIFLSIFFVRVASGERSRQYAFLVPMPLLACCVVSAAFPSLLANGVLLFIAGLFCAYRPLSLRRLWFVSLSCAAVSLVLGASPGIYEVRELTALRREFPVQPLAGRLDYELTTERNRLRQVNLAPAVAALLDETELLMERGARRRHQFAQIHNREYERFVRSSGFGVTRMIRPRAERLRRRPLQNIPFDGSSATDVADKETDWTAFQWIGKSDEIEHLHQVSRLDFLDPAGFGAVIEQRRRVAGFIEHGFHRSPSAGLENRERWTIVRLELVSLLRFDEPRVYVLEHLPRMDQLSREDIRTRPLDTFEVDALEQLRSEKDLVAIAQGGEHRMLGSLRATNQCLECHHGARGELLGAFSYILRAGSVDDRLSSGK